MARSPGAAPLVADLCARRELVRPIAGAAPLAADLCASASSVGQIAGDAARSLLRGPRPGVDRLASS
jgi:hypothetical protein